MKLIKNLSIILLSVFTLMSPALAEDIYSIHTDVQIDVEGTAHVKQIWKTNATEGTEYYIPMENMNHMELIDYKVSSGDGRAFEEVEWDIDRSFEEKAYTYGINPTSRGFELCFGKSEYGENTYILEYKFLNAVQAFEDYDGFNIRFVNDYMSPSPDEVSIDISLPGVSLNDDIARVWGFGFEGNLEFVDGIIKGKSDYFNSSSHMTILMRLNKDLVRPSIQGQGSFEDMREMAFEESTYKENFDVSDYNDETRFSISGIIFFLTFAASMIVIIVSAIVESKSKYNKPRNLRDAKIDKGYYYRDNPVDGHLPSMYLFNSYRANKDVSNLMTTYLLKWLKEGAIDVEESEKTILGIFKDKEVRISFLTDRVDICYKSEEQLWKIMLNASKSDKILEEDEFKNYVKSNHRSFEKVEEMAITEAYDYLYSQAYYLAKSTRFSDSPIISEAGIQEYKNTFGMKHFLEDFTLINEREAIEVKLWDIYLIFASVLGIADKVVKQFEDIYPDYSFAQDAYEQGLRANMYYSYLNSFSNNSYQAYKSSIRAESVRSSSGRGGGTSFGGGGGFSGGGSGGGSR